MNYRFIQNKPIIWDDSPKAHAKQKARMEQQLQDRLEEAISAYGMASAQGEDVVSARMHLYDVIADIKDFAIEIALDG